MLMLVLCCATHVLLLVTSARKFKKLTAKGIFMFSGSAHQADRWLSIKTMHFLVFCIISVKIKRLSETPPWSFWKKTKTVVPLDASSFEPSAIILVPLVLSPPCLLSPISGSPCCWLCCHHPPPTMCWWHREIGRQGVMVTHLFNCRVTDKAL